MITLHEYSINISPYKILTIYLPRKFKNISYMKKLHFDENWLAKHMRHSLK